MKDLDGNIQTKCILESYCSYLRKVHGNNRDKETFSFAFLFPNSNEHNNKWQKFNYEL